MRSSFRQTIGSLLFDRPFAGWPVFFPRLARVFGRSWRDFHNRGDRLVVGPDGKGIACSWQWSTDLNVCRSCPRIGRLVYRRALEEWPIRLSENPSATQPVPDVSFIIGHRGAERVPHLLMTIKSILAQEGASVECLIIEQSGESILDGKLPKGARLFHTPPPDPDMPYSRSWAFNIGARHARGRVLIFHDNDLLAPAGYAREVMQLVEQGHNVVRLQRFVFYLSQHDTAVCLRDGDLSLDPVLEMIRQNCEGGTLAVERDAYFALGGHDESFVGWGGEDNEMFDRCRSVACYPFGYLPFVHLYHGPQPRLQDPNLLSTQLRERLSIPAFRRIEELSTRSFGQLSGPVGRSIDAEIQPLVRGPA